MSDLRLDTTTGDLLISNFDLSVTDSSSESLAQRLSIKLKFFKGEWFLNLGFGIPYYQDILKKNVSQALVDSILKEQILSTPGVVQLTSYSSDFNQSLRIYTVTFKVTNTEGETITLTEII